MPSGTGALASPTGPAEPNGPADQAGCAGSAGRPVPSDVALDRQRGHGRVLLVPTYTMVKHEVQRIFAVPPDDRNPRLEVGVAVRLDPVVVLTPLGDPVHHVVG